MDVALEEREGVVTTIPARFEEAISRAGEARLTGITITDDYAAPGLAASVCDLRKLVAVPWLRSFEILPGIAKSRIEHMEGLYTLADLRALAMHEYDELDLTRLPKLESVAIRDRPGLRGLETLAHLRHLRAWGWRTTNLRSFRLPQLESLWLAQVVSSVKSLEGFDHLVALRTLEIQHSRGVSTLGGLPDSLHTLRVQASPRLKDFSFLSGNKSLDFVFAEIVKSLDFVPTMAALTRVGFGDVESGDLSPLLRSKTLQAAFFAPRKKYSPSHAEIQQELTQRGGDRT
jgi:internalin A